MSPKSDMVENMLVLFEPRKEYAVYWGMINIVWKTTRYTTDLYRLRYSKSLVPLSIITVNGNILPEPGLVENCACRFETLCLLIYCLVCYAKHFQDKYLNKFCLNKALVGRIVTNGTLQPFVMCSGTLYIHAGSFSLCIALACLPILAKASASEVSTFVCRYRVK